MVWRPPLNHKMKEEWATNKDASDQKTCEMFQTIAWNTHDSWYRR